MRVRFSSPALIISSQLGRRATPLAATFHLVCALSELGEHHAARELNDDIITRRRVLGDEHPDTIMAGAFDLILRGLDLGGEPEWMTALREANKTRQQKARELNEDEPG
jgi:hypothetical protein